MTDTLDLSSHALVAISKESLGALRASLARDLGGNAGNYLYEAGYGGAAAIFDAFTKWLTAKGGPAASDLALDDFAAALGEFFATSGWGSMGFSVEAGMATVESSTWAESADGAATQLPCYFTSGVLTEFFGRVIDAPISVLETECRSLGHERCKFMIGTPERIQQVYDQLYGAS